VNLNKQRKKSLNDKNQKQSQSLKIWQIIKNIGRDKLTSPKGGKNNPTDPKNN